MARVIKEGKKLDVVARIKCHKCGSKVEFVKGDIKGDQRGENYVACPSCSAFINSSVLKWVVPRG